MIFDQKSIKNPIVGARWEALSNSRRDFIETDMKLRNSSVNVIPPDVFTELDTRTKQLLTDPTMDVLYHDLRSVSTPVSTGTYIQTFRVNDYDEASTVSMTGNEKPVFVKSDRRYLSDPVPVHSSGFTIGWRESEALARGDWNKLVDENDAAVRSVRKSILDHITGARPYEWSGVRTHGLLTDTDRVQQIKAPVKFDDAKTSGKDIKDGLTKVLMEAQTKSFILAPRTLYVSPEIYANFYRDYSDTIDKTIFEKIATLPQVGEIKQTSILSGNQMLLGVISNEYIQLLTAQEIATTPILRLRPQDNYEFEVSGIVGTQIRVDSAGHTAWAMVK